jgi:hypothetical protein
VRERRDADHRHARGQPDRRGIRPIEPQDARRRLETGQRHRLAVERGRAPAGVDQQHAHAVALEAAQPVGRGPCERGRIGDGRLLLAEVVETFVRPRALVPMRERPDGEYRQRHREHQVARAHHHHRAEGASDGRRPGAHVRQFTRIAAREQCYKARRC